MKALRRLSQIKILDIVSRPQLLGIFFKTTRLMKSMIMFVEDMQLRLLSNTGELFFRRENIDD